MTKVKSPSDSNSRKMDPSIFDAESILKRQKRIQRIERACKILEARQQNPTSVQLSLSDLTVTQNHTDNNIVKIVSRTSQNLKEKMKVQAPDELKSSPLVSSDQKIVSDKSSKLRSPSKFANEPPLSAPDSNNLNSMKQAESFCEQLIDEPIADYDKRK